MMTQIPPSPMTPTVAPITYALDQEHGGLRGGVLLAFIGGGLLAFIISGSLIADSGFDLLSVLIGLGAAFGSAVLVERLLKRVWPSGRELRVAADGITLSKRGTVEQVVQADDAITPLLWMFRINRRSRVPKGWFMVACALERDDQRLIVYTLMSPKLVEAFPQRGLFTTLTPRKELEKTANNPLRAGDDLRAQGEQRRLREAENQRWLTGAEMTTTDFIAYLDMLHTRFPDWMPRS